MHEAGFLLDKQRQRGDQPMVDAGYWTYESVLSPRECELMIETLSRLGRRRNRAGIRHLMSIPEIANIASDHRLLRIARQVLGDKAVPFRATLFEKSGRANWLVVWHQDTALPLESHFPSCEWGPWSSKAGIQYAHAPAWALERILALRVHLDASTADNGPLRVIPGTHRAGLMSDDEIMRHARSRSAVECQIPQGGLLAMRPLLLHASSRARTGVP